jgi:hypothetical protein
VDGPPSGRAPPRGGDEHGGGTILLHDSDRTSAPGSWRVTLAALAPVVEGCRDRGWEVGTLAAHDLPEPRLPRW